MKSDNLLLSSLHQPTLKHAKCPIRQKQAKKRRHEAFREGKEEDKKVTIDRAQELATHCVVCKAKFNALSKEMIKLETCLRSSHLVMNGLKFLGTNKLSCPDEGSKKILCVMEQGLEERWP